MSKSGQKSYLEHVAIRVKDIHWHIRFFHDVLGMTAREIDGPADNPNQYWTIGGMQFMATPDFKESPSNSDGGWLAHLGVMVSDLPKALEEAKSWGVKELPQGSNWLQLPDGLAVELMQAAPGTIEDIQKINPRAAY